VERSRRWTGGKDTAVNKR